MKPELREEAVLLRQQGSSLKEIAEKLKISSSTASLWLRHLKLSKTAKLSLRRKQDLGRNKANEVIREKNRLRSQGIDLLVENYLALVSFNPNHAKAICAFLYGCEGAKNDTRVNFINSDPNLIRFFLILFRKAFSVDERKFRVLMHLHEYHNERKQKKFWASVTGISENQFTKTYHKKNGKKNIRENYQGCVSIRYGSGDIQKELVRVYREMLRKGDRVFS